MAGPPSTDQKPIAAALIYQRIELGQHLKQALLDAGVAIAVETRADVVDPQVLGRGIDVVVVNLDPELEELLDTLADHLDAIDRPVIYNEGQSSAGLSGWDQARWARHLAAKIRGELHANPPPPPNAEPIPVPVRTVAPPPPAAAPPRAPAGAVGTERASPGPTEIKPAAKPASPPEAPPSPEPRAARSELPPTLELPIPELLRAAPSPPAVPSVPDVALDLGLPEEFAALPELDVAPAASNADTIAIEPTGTSETSIGAVELELDPLGGLFEPDTSEQPSAERPVGATAAEEALEVGELGELEALFEAQSAAAERPAQDELTDLDALLRQMEAQNAPAQAARAKLELAADAALDAPAKPAEPTRAASPPAAQPNRGVLKPPPSEWSLTPLDDAALDLPAAKKPSTPTAPTAPAPAAKKPEPPKVFGRAKFDVEPTKSSAEDELAGFDFFVDESMVAATPSPSSPSPPPPAAVARNTPPPPAAPSAPPPPRSAAAPAAPAKGARETIDELNLDGLGGISAQRDVVADALGELSGLFAEDDALAAPAGASTPTALLPDLNRVVVLGASIGGPEAVREFLGRLGPDVPAAFVLAQHMGAEFLDLMTQQLARATKLKVSLANDGARLRHGEVIVVPIGKRVTIDDGGYVRLGPAADSPYSPSIDQVLIDMADRFGARAQAIIFSGMASDAIEGSRYLAQRGGQIWAQDPETCVISSMIEGAQAAGVVSYLGSPTQLAQRLSQVA